MRRGFSLMEILVAVGVLAIGLLTLVGAVAYGLSVASEGEKHHQAVEHARRLIALTRARDLPYTQPTVPPGPTSGINDAPSVRRPLGAPPFAGDGFPPDAGFERNIRLDWDYPGYRADRLVKVTVTLYWQSKGRERSLTLTGVHKQP